MKKHTIEPAEQGMAVAELQAREVLSGLDIAVGMIIAAHRPVSSTKTEILVEKAVDYLMARLEEETPENQPKEIQEPENVPQKEG